jgi:stage II sporulation protein D
MSTAAPSPVQPPPPDPAPAPAAAVDLTPAVTGPPIRIGLYTSASEVKISSLAEFYLVEKIPESTRQPVSGEVQIRVEREGQAQDTYRIQVAALSRPEAAEALRGQLGEKFGVPAVIRESTTGQSRQVRIGEFETREEAQAYLPTVRDAGYPDAMVIRDFTTRGAGEPSVALRGPNRLFRVSPTGFLFVPATPANFLRLDGKPYRGVLDVILNKSGRITVVNQLGMEEYLFGVVPSELSPSRFPEFDALAAQSIAARTYALKNLGRFRNDGFDLTADVRTQVYGGVGAERQPTNEAVQKTAGFALYYEGNLIDAMYTSTCGGRTEDFSNVFDSAPVPYLRSVACAVEGSGTAPGAEMRIAARNNLPDILIADDGGVANRDIELASVLDIAGKDDLTIERLSGTLRRDEARDWIERARKAAATGRNGAVEAGGDLESRAGFLRCAAESFFGTAEIDRRISPADADYFIGNLKDGGQVPEAARRAIAYLMQAQLWRPYPDNTARPAERVRRADALGWLARWVESIRPELVRSGVFGSAVDPAARITIKAGNRDYDTPLGPEVRLFKTSGGRSTPVDAINLIGNEKLRYHLSPAGAIDFMEVELNTTGASSDRFSPVASWQTPLSRQVIAEKLRAIAENIGELKDLKPARLGSSGRVVQMLVVGSRGSVQMNGYRFRNALGLRDTLFTISRELNPDGRVDRFVFNGRGWGHGVGMCQVGAFGMARSGRSYEEILKTYYQGVELRKAY